VYMGWENLGKNGLGEKILGGHRQKRHGAWPTPESRWRKKISCQEYKQIIYFAQRGKSRGGRHSRRKGWNRSQFCESVQQWRKEEGDAAIKALLTRSVVAPRIELATSAKYK